MKICHYFKRENGCISCVHPNPIFGDCPQDQCEQDDDYVPPIPKTQSRPKQSEFERQMQEKADDDWYVYGDGFSDNYCDEV